MATTSNLPEAFLLLTLENVTLRSNHYIQTGVLGLECVTFPVPNGERDVFLVFKLNDLELPVEHARMISLDTSSRDTRTYTLRPTEIDPSSITLDIPTTWHPSFLQDIETFDGILAQYTQFSHDVSEQLTPAYISQVDEKSRPLSEYRGRLVLVNEDNGEVVGEFDKKINVHEDSTLQTRGHEKDPVVIEVPEGQTLDNNEEQPLEFFARVIPPDQQDWMTQSATVVSHAITAGTSLFITVLTGASNLYIKRSAPSPHHSSNARTPNASPTPPPRALAFLTSEKTRQNVATAHVYTGKAVVVSGKTLEILHGIVKKAMGSDKKSKGKTATTPALPQPPPQRSTSYQPYQPQRHNLAFPSDKPISRSPSPTPSYSSKTLPPGAPPPYQASGSGYLSPHPKPPLPPRISPNASPYSSRSTTPVASPQELAPPPPLPPRKISTTKRVLLSADLIFSTLDVSTKRLLDAGTKNVGAIMGHKYGTEAGQSSEMMVGTARNVALVYVDVRGMGRKAILKVATKEFVKGRVGSSK